MSSERKRILEQAFRYTRNEKVDGDYLEFGVARGRSLILAARASNRFASESGASCRLIGFDSFEGFPEPTGVDAIFERFQEGEEYHGGEKVVHHHLRRNRIDRSNVELVNGWYEDTLTDDTAESLGLKNARVVNIDCDLYNSARQALAFMRPFLQDGTVLLFDDWLCYRADPEKGEQRAAREWMAENPSVELIPYRNYANVGQAFVVNLREPEDKQRERSAVQSRALH